MPSLAASDSPTKPIPARALPRRVRLVAFTGIALILVLYGATLSTQWRPSWDSALYLALADSLAGGEGYRYQGHAHSMYPPGVPILLAGILLTYGPSYAAMRLVMILLALAGAVAAWLLARSRLGRAEALLVAGLYALCPSLLEGATYILSDLPFAALVLATLALCESSREAPRGRRLVWLILLATSCILFRTAGVALAGAMVIGGLTRGWQARDGRQAIAWSAIGLIALAAGTIWALHAGREVAAESRPPGLPGFSYDHPTYTSQLMLADPTRSDSGSLSPSSFLTRLLRNARFYAWAVSGDLTGSPRLASALGIYNVAVLPVLLAGLFIHARKGASLSDLFFLLYAFLLLVWPWHYQRFLLPVLPMLLMYALEGLRALTALLLRAGQRFAGALRSASLSLRAQAVVPMILMGIAGLGHLGSDLDVIAHERARPYPPRPAQRAIVEASRWLTANAGTSDVIVGFEAAIIHRLSGRPALSPPWTHPAAEQLEMILGSGAAWVVVNPIEEPGGGYLEALLKERPDLFALRAVVERAEIWEVRRGSTAPAPSPPG